MRVSEIRIQHFRGFDELTLKPKGHVVLMGEPGAGRSDLIEALSRVMDADASRTRVTTELDFHGKDTSLPIRIGLALADLGPELEQHFLDYLELWDTEADRLVPETDSPDMVDQQHYEWVVRLEYLAQWLPDGERCEEWVYYPKVSDSEANSYVHARRRDIEQLGFAQLRWAGGRILDLGARSPFRRLIERSSGDDFISAITQYVQDVAQAASRFGLSAQVQAALEEVIRPLRDLLRIQETDLSQLFQFAPEGGSLSGLLRSLGPSIDLEDGTGVLPAWRRGTTTASLFRIAEVLALSSSESKILAVDDLGDAIDPASAVHLASVMRRLTGQVWISTRVSSVAEIFDPQEVVRLGRAADGVRFARQGRQPSSKAEAIASKHWHRNLLPALSYRSVVVVEGPNDFAALHALAIRLSKERGEQLPATRGVSIVNAGVTGSGGYPNVLRLAGAAREMGLRAVGVVDGDTRDESLLFLQESQSLADAVVRLPDNTAIEVAIVRHIQEGVLRQAVLEIAASAGQTAPPNLAQLSGNALEDTAVSFIKKNSLHAAFIEALPGDHFPPLATQLLRTAVEAASGDTTGVIQL